ncbi:MAG: HEAT repeat domain-containing protein, partial [Planctomycetota bacterium]
MATGALGASPAVARPAEPAPQTRGAPGDEEFSQAELAALCTRLIGTQRERAERRLATRPGAWLATYLRHAVALPAWQRAAFVRAGAQLGERRARRLVRHVWLDEDDPTVLRAAAHLAARVHERTVLRQLLRSEDADERALAVRSLGADTEAVAALLERLRRDPDVHVREAAARSLARHVEPRVAEGLLAAAVSDRQPRVRRQAARSLQRCLRRLPAGSLRDEALQLVSAQPLDECVLPLVPDLLAGSGIGRLRPLLDTEDARLRAAVLRALV